jgi:hypothetical protein
LTGVLKYRIPRSVVWHPNREVQDACSPTKRIGWATHCTFYTPQCSVRRLLFYQVGLGAIVRDGNLSTRYFLDHSRQGLDRRDIGDHGFCSDQEPSDRASILQRRSNNLGRIDDARLDHIDIEVGLRIEPVIGLLAL